MLKSTVSITLAYPLGYFHWGNELGQDLGVFSRCTIDVRSGTRIGLVLLVVLSMLAAWLIALPAAAADACAPGTNKIACENSKPGSPWQEWEAFGAGDSTIQGFATDISVNVGKRIDFKIDTDASAYSIEIYRTGWYDGLGARKVATVQPSASLPQIQRECLKDQATEITDCGTWDVSASWDVPSDAVSGVYIAKLQRTDTGGRSHITFVVRDESSTSDVLVQTSDPTWHAYNLYGGSDFYSGAGNGRAYKISYNRPFATRGGIEARDFYFGAEYPLVRFLERNGYDVSYFSGVDTDRHGELLKNHKTFISVGHDEYWSGDQRKNVEAARDAGVNLQFLTGNEVYWRTRYEPSTTDEKDYRTLVSYKETWANTKLDPSDEWTGTWRDPRFASNDQGAGLPENALVGTAYKMNHGALPVTVNDREGKLRMWRDTELSGMAPGTSKELAPYTVGYEANEDLPNGFRPPGLIHLSTTTGEVPQILVDYGNTVAEGTTTHNTTLYRAASGALVFSAGSIQWSWGLDEWHDGDGAPQDRNMQQAQANLLADMGALPTTLMDGLSMPEPSTDTKAPSLAVTSTIPESIPSGEKLVLSGTASDANGQVAGVEYSTDGGVSWNPAQGAEKWSLSVYPSGLENDVVLVRAIDDSANFPDQATEVRLGIQGPHTVYGQQVPEEPDSGDNDPIELGLRFSPSTGGYVTGVRFFKSDLNTGTHTGSLWSLSGQRLAQATFANESASGWQSVLFDEPVEIHAGTEYVVSYSAPNGHYASQWQTFGYRGIDADPLQVAGGFGTTPAGVYSTNGGYPSSSWERMQYYVDPIFDTGEDIALSAYGHTPADTARSVQLGTPIKAQLSKPVDPDSVKFTLKDQNGDLLPGTTTYDPSLRQVTFQPQGTLPNGATLTGTITAKDLSGNAVSRGGQWSFTTVMADPTDPNDCPCGLFPDSMLPDVAAVQDGRPVSLGTRFTSTVPGTIDGIEFYLSAEESGPHTGWLFAADGRMIAEAQFPGGSVSGWQYAKFSAPVPIEAGVEYIAAYRSNGVYPVTAAGLNDPVSSGALQTSATAGQFGYDGNFPGNRISTNYLVDVRFTADDPPVHITAQSPQSGQVNVPVDSKISATFSETLGDGYTMNVLADAAMVVGNTTFSQDRKTLEFTPDAQLPHGAVVTVSFSGIAGSESGATQIQSYSFRTAATGLPEDPTLCPCGLFPSNTEPANPAENDGQSVTLGTAFTPTQNGVVSGVEIYMSPGETGAHQAWLYTADGETLAELSMPATSMAGWHYAAFSSPVPVIAGSQYVVAYRSNGIYPVTPNALANSFTSGPLSTGQNAGRFSYGDNFPSNTSPSNYLVDVRFQATDNEPAALALVSQTPAAQAQGVDPDTKISANFNRAISPGFEMTVSTAEGDVAGQSDLVEDGKRIEFTANDPMDFGTAVTVRISGIAGVDGGQLEPLEWSFRVTQENNPGDPNDCPCSIFPSSTVPGIPSISDGRSVSLGTRFNSSVDGMITGLSYYQAGGESGTHAGWLYTASGQLLGTLQFESSPVPGWVRATFDSPIAITRNTEYVAVYRSNGFYSATAGGLASTTQHGPLSTPATAGQFGYGTGFPGNRSNASYLVDVLFAPGKQPLSVDERHPAAGAANAPVNTPISVTFSEPLKEGASLAVQAEDSAVAGILVVSADRRGLTWTPEADLPSGTVVTVTPTGIAGESSGPAVIAPWSFRTVTAVEDMQSFIDAGDVPAVLDPQDNAPVELGVKLKATKDIEVHGIRYYHGPQAHSPGTGSIYGSSGQRLATVDFSPAQEVGWNTAFLQTPVELSAGTVFTVSHYAPNGGYVFTPGAFGGGLVTGALQLEGPNGLFGYGAGGLPTNSWNNSNYFTDLLYSTIVDDDTVDLPEGPVEPSGEPATTHSSSPTPEPSETSGTTQQPMDSDGGTSGPGIEPEQPGHAPTAGTSPVARPRRVQRRWAGS